MKSITQAQAQTRFAAIPETLQDAIFSPQVAEIIALVLQQYNVNDDNSDILVDLVGWVLLGFIHPEDLPPELVARTGIPLQAAKDILGSLTSKIFGPLKTDLDKTYAPLPHDVAAGAPGPKIIQEIITPPKAQTAPVRMPQAPAAPVMRSVVPPPAKLPDVISQTVSGSSMGLNATPYAGNRNNAAPAPMAKPNNPQTGWSKTTPQEPVVKLGSISPGMPSPAPVQKSVPQLSPSQKLPGAPAINSMAPPKAVGEFERIESNKAKPMGASNISFQANIGGVVAGASKSTLPGAPTPATAPSAPAPAPFIMQQRENVAPVQKTADFHLQQSGMQNQLNEKTAPLPIKPAILELGSIPKPAAAPAPKVVHYSDYKTTTSPTPPPPAGPRNVTELTSQPIPSAPPGTPTPPQAPPSRVITKDFLEEGR